MTSDRSEEPRRGPSHGLRRGLPAVAAVCFVGAGALAFAGFRADGVSPVPVLEVDDARATEAPSTVPPLVTEPSVVTERSVVTEVSAVPDTVEPADASAMTLPPDGADRSAYTEPQRNVPSNARPRPVGLQISTVDVGRYPVRAIGLEDDGQLEIPDETEIGWYKYGATAGHPGSTVLAAHVSWNGSLGPFADLGSVEPGDQIEVALHDGTTRNYEVTERTMYEKLELPKARIWRRTGAEELVLITCGGDFNPDIRRYNHNIVVYAVPVG